MLHVDVWRDGQPVAMDGGSFSYNSPDRFTAFGAATHHNVLTVDGIEPVRKFSRFLYLPWPKGAAVPVGGQALRCSHDGYAALGIDWSREVSVGASGGFVVRDLIRGAAGHRLRWHWRLVDAPWKEQGNDAVEVHAPGLDYRISWAGSGTRSLLRADDKSAFGWWSPHYGIASPAVALLLELDAREDIEWVTQFQPLS
jgi:hypothetical protein